MITDMSDLVANIDSRIANARQEIDQLEGARRALVTNQQSAQPRRIRKASSQPKPQVVPAGKLTALLADSEGMSTSELAKATNGKADQILGLLRELEEADQVRRTGERRGTRWHLITDEDRISARAAELAKRSR